MDPRQPLEGPILEVQEGRMEDRTRSRGPSALLQVHAYEMPSKVLVSGMDHTVGRLSGSIKKFIRFVGSDTGLHKLGEDRQGTGLAHRQCEVNEQDRSNEEAPIDRQQGQHRQEEEAEWIINNAQGL